MQRGLLYTCLLEKMPHDELLQEALSLYRENQRQQTDLSKLEVDFKELKRLIDDSNSQRLQSDQESARVLATSFVTEIRKTLNKAIDKGKHDESTRRALIAAEARHSAPGGSREISDIARQRWATGEFTSRDQCAQEIHQSLGYSFATVRKALRNTPKPDT